MELRPLGKTGIKVSRLCFGTLTMGPLQCALTTAQGAALFEHAFACGINFLDTAEIYGTYPHVREALRLKPDAVVCTKSYSYDEATAEASFKKAVDGIGREYIDVFLLHEQESALTLRGHAKAIEHFLKRKEQGYIGAVGVSTHYVGCVAAVCEHPELDVVFPLINKFGTGIADGTPDEMLAAIGRCHDLGKGVIAMKPLGGGHHIARREEAFSYILSQPTLDTVAVGMQSVEEIDYNISVFSGEQPNESVARLTGDKRRRLIVEQWCEGCGACERACGNHAIKVVDGKAKVDRDKCALCGYCARVCPIFCVKVI